MKRILDEIEYSLDSEKQLSATDKSLKIKFKPQIMARSTIDVTKNDKLVTFFISLRKKLVTYVSQKV